MAGSTMMSVIGMPSSLATADATVDLLRVPLMALRIKGDGLPSARPEHRDFQVDPASSTARTHHSRLRAWIIGEHCTEMIAALNSPGVAPGSPRS